MCSSDLSWFAAKKYCECEGKRLPTTDEWEYVAQADAQSIDARKKKHYQEYIVRSMLNDNGIKSLEDKPKRGNEANVPSSTHD